MEDERDLVVFQDDEGNEFTMEVLDYFFYEGEEYALLADAEETDAAEDGQDDADVQREAYVMKINPVGEDEEEFVPVDEELAAKLIEILENDYDAEDEGFDDEDEE